MEIARLVKAIKGDNARAWANDMCVMRTKRRRRSLILAQGNALGSGSIVTGEL